MADILSRSVGTMEKDLADGTGLRCHDYVATIQTNLTSVVNAIAGANAVVGISQAPYLPLAINSGRLTYPSTLCVRLNQSGLTANGSFRARISGLDCFGNGIVEETPVVATGAVANNWIYLAKVFSTVNSVEYKMTGHELPCLISVGQRFDWVRTEDGTNTHLAGRNLGIGLPAMLRYTPIGELWKPGRALDRSALGPVRRKPTSISVDFGAPVQPTAGDTITIDGIIYTYRAAPLPAPFAILIGASPAATIQNTWDAINRSGVPGTQYHIGTSEHPTVRAVSSTAQVLTLTVKVPGAEGNLITVASAGATEPVLTVVPVGEGDTGEIVGVVSRDWSAAGDVRNVSRTQYTIGDNEEGWAGTIEKINFIPNLILGQPLGTYVTGDVASLYISILSAA